MWELINLKCSDLLTCYFLGFSFSSSYPNSFFTGRMNHAVKPVFLQQCWRWQIQCFPAHMIIFIRGWLIVIHTHMFLSITDDIGESDAIPVLASQMFSVSGKHLWCLSRLCSFSSTDSSGHKAITLFLYHPFEWPWGLQVKSRHTFGRIPWVVVF